jgi:hypothetical protein
MGCLWLMWLQRLKKRREQEVEALNIITDSGSDACGTGVQEDLERE